MTDNKRKGDFLENDIDDDDDVGRITSGSNLFGAVFGNFIDSITSLLSPKKRKTHTEIKHNTNMNESKNNNNGSK